MDEDERPKSRLSEKVKQAEDTLAQAENELNQLEERAAATEKADESESPDTADPPD